MVRDYNSLLFWCLLVPAWMSTWGLDPDTFVPGGPLLGISQPLTIKVLVILPIIGAATPSVHWRAPLGSFNGPRAHANVMGANPPQNLLPPNAQFDGRRPSTAGPRSPLHRSKSPASPKEQEKQVKYHVNNTEKD